MMNASTQFFHMVYPSYNIADACNTSNTSIDNVFTKGCYDNHIAGILNNTIGSSNYFFHCQELNLYYKTVISKYIEIELLIDTNIDILQNELDRSNIYKVIL